MTTSSELRIAVKVAVDSLVAGKYEHLAKLSSGVRLSAEEIRQAIIHYGEDLIEPPETAFDSIDAIEVKGSGSKRWSVRFDLWTRNSGRSDLSLEMTVIEEPSGQCKFEIDDIHVL